MGKDGSGEPASKKFKQSQLCFKSPKANGNLKSKVASPLNNENVCKSQKVHSSDTSKATNESVEVNSFNGSQEKTAPPVDSVPSPSDNKENVLDSTNVPEAPVIVVSEDETEDNKDECVPMDVDSPTDVTSVTQESKPSESDKTDKELITDKPSVKTESGKSNDKQSNADKPLETKMDSSTSESLTRNEDSKEAGSENASEANTPSKADKSALTDVSVTSANESLSPKSEISISSDSEDGGAATSSSSTPVTPKTPRQMTPKMLKRHEESVKKKQLQQQLKAERRARKEQIRNERIKMKIEEEEKKKQLKEERKKKRIAELELKNEEKRQKQEDKKQRKEREEEERRLQKEQKAEEKRKEEEKKEQEEKKKARAQSVFVSFFKKQPGSGSGNTAISNDASNESSNSPAFMPFPVKSDMRLAATVRRQLSESERQDLDSVLNGEGKSNTYLQILKQRTYTPRTSLPTWLAPVSEELHDCIVIEAQVEDQGEENGDQPGKGSEEVLDSSKHTKTTRRGKLLQFCENRRPAYFGTWTKQSKHVSGRNPFAKDNEGVLDYEVDSDSEWEEEEEGEDLESVKDDDNEGQEEELEEGENGYLLDNTFVPHGYLSDEEQPDEEDIHESVEKQKDRLVALKEEFDEEMKQGGAQALKPKLLGCLWVSNSTTQVSKGSLYEVLLSHRAIWDESNCPLGIDMEPEATPVNEKSPTQTPPSKKLPEIVLQEIARMVDGSRWSLSRLVREVGEVLTIARPQNPVSQRVLTRAIKQMAAKTMDSNDKSVWTIKPEFRSEYKLQDLEVPAQVTPPTSRVKSKDTLLDNFLRGGHQQKPDQVLGAPPAKKRISLTPVIQMPPEEKMEVTPEQKKVTEVKPVIKKRVAFVTLPPRTPGTSPQSRSLPRTPGPWPSSAEKQSTLKPHVDTPRPPVNKFLNKASPSQPQEPIVISDESNP